jgi:hypothetical protein
LENYGIATFRFIPDSDAMTYLDPYESPEHLDAVRRTHFERSGSRPSAKLRRPAPELKKAHQRASGRLRTAAYRCSLDMKRKPESDVIGMALLVAVATRSSETGFDPVSAGIVSSAFSDLISRGYSRSEIESVFKRFRKNFMVRPDYASNDKGCVAPD